MEDGADDSLTVQDDTTLFLSVKSDATFLTECSHCNEAAMSRCREQHGHTLDNSTRRQKTPSSVTQQHVQFMHNSVVII